MIKINVKKKDVGSPAESAFTQLGLDDNSTPMYRADAPPLGSVARRSVKQRKFSSSLMTTGCRSKKMIDTSTYEQGVAAEVKTPADVEHSVDAATANSGALQLKCYFLFRCKREPRKYNASSDIDLAMSWGWALLCDKT